MLPSSTNSDGAAPIQVPGSRTPGAAWGSPAHTEIHAAALVASSDHTSSSPVSNCVSIDIYLPEAIAEK